MYLWLKTTVASLITTHPPRVLKVAAALPAVGTHTSPYPHPPTGGVALPVVAFDQKRRRGTPIEHSAQAVLVSMRGCGRAVARTRVCTPIT